MKVLLMVSMLLAGGCGGGSVNPQEQETKEGTVTLRTFNLVKKTDGQSDVEINVRHGSNETQIYSGIGIYGSADSSPLKLSHVELGQTLTFELIDANNQTSLKSVQKALTTAENQWIIAAGDQGKYHFAFFDKPSLPNVSEQKVAAYLIDAREIDEEENSQLAVDGKVMQANLESFSLSTPFELDAAATGLTLTLEDDVGSQFQCQLETGDKPLLVIVSADNKCRQFGF
ncbi:hypothetical protein [Veronia nyctiphanis]|nr:hypothetical protein [Veronia nyctiphanis]